MAVIKSQSDRYTTIKNSDYHRLIEDHLIVEAIKKLGFERLPQYRAIRELIDDGHIEVSIRPVKQKYK